MQTLEKHQLGRHPHTLDFSVAVLRGRDKELSALYSTWPLYAIAMHGIGAFQTIVT